MSVEELQIKPYARLLTMLGDQLIKNEKVALIEIIKNSYDADADWVRVNFSDFEKSYGVTKNSKIIIEDDGDGMDKETIATQWLHPAAPGKKKKKKQKATTSKGRYIQGEKGIGRFALLKLGRVIKVITRPRKCEYEYVITYDFSKYDDEFTSIDGKSKDIPLEELTVIFETRKPEIIVEQEIRVGKGTETRPSHGTRIEISNLKTKWTEKKVETVYKDLQKLQGVFPDKKGEIKEQADFNVSIYFNDNYQTYGEEIQGQLSVLLEDKTVFRIEGGHYDQKKKEFSYLLNGANYKISLSDPAITGLSLYKRNFSGLLGLDDRTTECGDFDFNFYIFDFNPSAPPKYKLDQGDKDLIKPHRIYLYRDGVRVYPYGDPDDDWLRIDQHRGTIAAGDFLSNDQVMGRVNISHSGNPDLKDKTNREGLIEIGAATSDFIGLLQVFLAYIRKGPYKRYIEDNTDKKEIDIFKGDHVQKEMDGLKGTAEKVSKAKDLKEAVKIVSAADKKLVATEKMYLAERSYLIKRAERTEELAGVGLSVEASYHDVFSILEKVLKNLDDLINGSIDQDIEELEKELAALRGMVSFAVDQMQDVQMLFSSTKQRKKSIKIKEIVEKVIYIYRRLLKREGINCEIKKIGSPLVAKTTDAVVLQLLINLFDNAIYWLKTIDKKNKEIVITLDGDNGDLIFSDNGPGIPDEDRLYIFNAFYSGKGEEGRGLGLYIAQQLLERHGYHIGLASSKSEKILLGANFVISFVSED